MRFVESRWYRRPTHSLHLARPNPGDTRCGRVRRPAHEAREDLAALRRTAPGNTRRRAGRGGSSRGLPRRSASGYQEGHFAFWSPRTTRSSALPCAAAAREDGVPGRRGRERGRGDRGARAPVLRRRAHGRADAGAGRARGDAAHHRAMARRKPPADHRDDRQRYARGSRGVLQAGMDDYVAKPIRPDDLAAALARSRPLADPAGLAPNAEPGSVIDSAALDHGCANRSATSSSASSSPRSSATRRPSSRPFVARSSEATRRSAASRAHAEVQRRHLRCGLLGALPSTRGRRRPVCSPAATSSSGRPRPSTFRSRRRWPLSATVEPRGPRAGVDPRGRRRSPEPQAARPLARAGRHRVETAANGREALERVPEGRLTSSCSTSSCRAGRHLRARAAQGRSRSAARARDHDLRRRRAQGVMRCVEVGAEDYLSKPFDAVLLGPGSTRASRRSASTSSSAGASAASSRVSFPNTSSTTCWPDGRRPASRREPGRRDDHVHGRTGFTAFTETAPADRVLDILTSTSTR